MFSIELVSRKTYKNLKKITSNEEKITIILYEKIMGKVYWWESGQRATTLSY